MRFPFADTLCHSLASNVPRELDFTRNLSCCRLADSAVNLTDTPDMAESRGTTSNNAVRLPNQVRILISFQSHKGNNQKFVYDYGCRSVFLWDQTVLKRPEILLWCQLLPKKRRKAEASLVVICVRMSSRLEAKTLYQMIRLQTDRTAKTLSTKSR